MTIKYILHQGAGLNYQEKNLVRLIINSFRNPNSYYSVLQKIYNHSLHFTTVSSSFNLCTDNELQEIYKKANDPDIELTVKGNFHNNYHNSNILFDTQNKTIFCKDTYFSIKDSQTNRIYHILVEPPSIPKDKQFHIYFNELCDYQLPFVLLPKLEL